MRDDRQLERERNEQTEAAHRRQHGKDLVIDWPCGIVQRYIRIETQISGGSK